MDFFKPAGGTVFRQDGVEIKVDGIHLLIGSTILRAKSVVGRLFPSSKLSPAISIISSERLCRISIVYPFRAVLALPKSHKGAKRKEETGEDSGLSQYHRQQPLSQDPSCFDCSQF